MDVSAPAFPAVVASAIVTCNAPPGAYDSFPVPIVYRSRRSPVRSYRLPDLYCMIEAGRGDLAPVGGPCHIPDSAEMTTVDKGVCAACGIPELHRLILSSRRHPLATRRPCYRLNRAAMTAIDIDRMAGQSQPDLHRPIITG